jgi:rhamnosyltransferase
VTRLAVMAHYDPEGLVRPHVRRQVTALAEDIEDVVVVSTAPLTDDARRWLSARARLVERANYGYDFFSYKVGLDAAGDLTAYDEVIVCNDTFVGPLRPYGRIVADMAGRAADFWGFTETRRVRPHVQSFFVAFRPWTVDSRAFRLFWSEMEPISDRKQVILRYEVGMSQRLYDAGFASAAYFDENDADRTLGRRRVRWWAAHRSPLPRTRAEVARFRQRAGEAWNPSSAMADRALADGRLPYVKLDTLRYDPYGLDAGRLLTLCEQRFPDLFDGVRASLADTAAFYRPRPAEVLRPTPLPLRPLAPLVRYTTPGATR